MKESKKVTNLNKSKIQTRIDALMGEQRQHEAHIGLIGAQINVLLEAERILNGTGAAPKVAQQMEANMDSVNPLTAMISESKTPTKKNGSVDWKQFDKSVLNGLTKVRSMYELMKYAGGSMPLPELCKVAARFGVTRNPASSRRLSAEVSTALGASLLFKRKGYGQYVIAQ